MADDLQELGVPPNCLVLGYRETGDIRCCAAGMAKEEISSLSYQELEERYLRPMGEQLLRSAAHG